MQECRGGGKKISDERSFLSFCVLTSFNKDNNASISGEKKKCNEAFRGVHFLRIRKKIKVKSRLRSRSVRSRPRIQRSLMLVVNRRKPHTD